MTRIVERKKAILLREQGKSYGEILKEVRVSKSSLSLWLKDIPLSEKQIKHIKNIHLQAVEKYRQTMKTKRQIKLDGYYKQQKLNWLPFSNKDLFVAGLFLYWGEGNKANRSLVSLNNTDPSMIKFCLYWMINSLNIPKEKIRVQLHLYKDMNIQEQVDFWSSELSIHTKQFAKPYIKNTNRSDIDQKGFGHGTCGIYVGDTVLKENILMAIKAISENFAEKIK